MGLEVHGLLHRGPDGRWRPGPALAELAHRGVDPLLEAAAAVLPRLRDITGESVQLYRRDGTHRVCVAAAEPASGLRDTVPGRHPAADDGRAPGAKVLAAWADPATQRALLPEATFTERALLDVRRRGWAQSVAEREAGVASVSAPVRDAGGHGRRGGVGVGPGRPDRPAAGRAVGGGPAGRRGRPAAPAVARPARAHRRSRRTRSSRCDDRRRLNEPRSATGRDRPPLTGARPARGPVRRATAANVRVGRPDDRLPEPLSPDDPASPRRPRAVRRAEREEDP